MQAHDRAAAEANRNNVRHAEVRAHAANLHGKHALAREAVRQNAQVGGGTAHVDDHSVFQARQKRRAANGVRGAARNGENRVAHGVFGTHERAVVLAQVHLGVGDAFARKRRDEAFRRGFRNVDERRVQNGGVFALKQAHTADFARNGNGEIVAERLAHDGRGARLVACVDRRKHARDGDAVAFALHLVRNAAQLVLIERSDFAAIELVPAAHKEPLVVDGRAQLCRPVDHGLDSARRRRADTNHGNAIETLALDDGIRAVRRAKHRVADAGTIDALAGKHGLHGVFDAAHNVFGRGAFHSRDKIQVLVKNNGVSVGATNVDANAPVFVGHRVYPFIYLCRCELA